MWKSEWKIDGAWIRANEKWLLLLALGLILLILSFPQGGKEAGRETASAGAGISREEEGEAEFVSGTAAADPERRYEQEMERRVKEILKNVEGVGEVDVMITLRSSAEKVIRVDRKKSRSSTEEKDSAGGTRKLMSEEIGETSLMTGSSGAERPVIEKELEPEISGVIVSARGGGSPSVRMEISQALEALFGLPAHKIKVLKRVE